MTALLLLGRLMLSLVGLAWLLALLATWRGKRNPLFRISAETPPPEAPPPHHRNQPGAAPGVSVIIPARDEEANIGPCLDSVLSQDHPELEVIVLDDASSDATADIVGSRLEDPRLRLIRGQGEPPKDWLGKAWALQRAQGQASRPWLLFLDADVTLHPLALSRAMDYAISHELDLLSGLGRLEARGFWENLLQPVVGGLILAGNDLSQVNDPDRPEKAMANGQFLLFRREAYDRIGGHQAVKNNVLDDVGLAKTVKKEGLRFHLVFMRDLFSCRMYRGLAEIWQGWRKNLFAGMNHSWLSVALVCTGLFAMGLLPLILLILGLTGVVAVEWAAWGGALLLLSLAARFYMDRVFQQPAIMGLLQPLAFLLLIMLILDSALAASTGRARWKGRSVQAS